MILRLELASFLDKKSRRFFGMCSVFLSINDAPWRSQNYFYPKIGQTDYNHSRWIFVKKWRSQTFPNLSDFFVQKWPVSKTGHFHRKSNKILNLIKISCHFEWFWKKNAENAFKKCLRSLVNMRNQAISRAIEDLVVETKITLTYNIMVTCQFVSMLNLVYKIRMPNFTLQVSHSNKFFEHPETLSHIAEKMLNSQNEKLNFWFKLSCDMNICTWL